MGLKSILTDDLTGEAGDNIFSFDFGLDGKTYEIDLAEDGKGAALLRKVADQLVPVARLTSEPEPVKAKRSSRDKAETDAIREWARANGHTVGDRGRISNEIVTAYQAAQA